jgi:hypothetical protein
MSFFQQIGEAIGRGVAGGINAGLAVAAPAAPAAPVARAAPAAPAPVIAPRRRGRPPKALSAKSSNICKTPGCTSPVRCKGLCSAHYQASRRKIIKRK